MRSGYCLPMRLLSRAIPKQGWQVWRELCITPHEGQAPMKLGQKQRPGLGRGNSAQLITLILVGEVSNLSLNRINK